MGPFVVSVSPAVFSGVSKAHRLSSPGEFPRVRFFHPLCQIRHATSIRIR